MRWLRTPALHFVGMGVVLFALERWFGVPPGEPGPARVITITAAQLESLASDARRTRADPDRSALLDQVVDEEILYREALARGLDRGDQSIQWRLAEKMRFLSVDGHADERATPGVEPTLYAQAKALELDREDPLVRGMLIEKMRLLLRRAPDDHAPTDAELTAYLEQHRERFLQPARVSMRHVYFARPAAPESVRRILTELRAGSVGPDTTPLGDSFPLGSSFRAQSEQDLAHVFGTGFAAAVLALAPGEWTEIASPFGVHLVRVEQQWPESMPPLATVRSRVLAQLRNDQQDARLADALRSLRSRYTVRVEPAAGGRG